MLEEKYSLEGKTVVITGGGTGLGRSMILAMAKAGADAVITGRRVAPIEETAEEVRKLGRKALAISTDITDSDQVNRMVQKALDEFGKIDVLFNNAGIVRGQSSAPLWEITDEDWRLGIDTNLSGAFYCSRAVSKHMVDRGGGKIINTGSGVGLRGSRDSYIYGCAKGGLAQLTRTIATSLGRYGITCNCFIPGYFDARAEDDSSLDDLRKNEFIPIGRVGHPRESGPLAVFLASSASDYMNGEFLISDGGGLAGGVAPTGYAPVIPLKL